MTPTITWKATLFSQYKYITILYKPSCNVCERDSPTVTNIWLKLKVGTSNSFSSSATGKGPLPSWQCTSFKMSNKFFEINILVGQITCRPRLRAGSGHDFNSLDSCHCHLNTTKMQEILLNQQTIHISWVKHVTFGRIHFPPPSRGFAAPVGHPGMLGNAKFDESSNWHCQRGAFHRYLSIS